MLYRLIFVFIIVSLLGSSYGAQEIRNKALIADEIKKLVKTSVLNEAETTTYTYKAVCERLLALYQAVHEACIVDRHHFYPEKKAQIDIAIKRLRNLSKLKKSKMLSDDAYSILLNFEKSIQITKNLTLKNQTPEQLRKTIVDWILALTQDVPTQLEKSLRIHHGKDNALFALAYPMQWTSKMWGDQKFIQFLKSQITYISSNNIHYNDAYSGTPPQPNNTPNNPSPLSDEAYIFMFQNLLVNEKLNPDCFVFYQSATPKLLGVYLFQDLMARFLHQNGNPFDIKSFAHDDVDTDEFRAIIPDKIPKTVRDLLVGKVSDPSSKQVMSSSYSIFGGGNPSFKSFFKVNGQASSTIGDVFKSIYDDANPHLDISGSTVITTPNPAWMGGSTNRTPNKYEEMIINKFTDRPIQNHLGYQQKGYINFPNIVQFFIPKDKVDDIVYWGGTMNSPIRSSLSGKYQNGIKVVLDAFIAQDDQTLLTYYNTVPTTQHAGWAGMGQSTLSKLAEKDDYSSLQGKIGASTRAYFDEAKNGRIKTYFSCIRPDQYVVIDDIRTHLILFMQEDILKALTEGNPSQKVRESNLYKTLGIASGDKNLTGSAQTLTGTIVANQSRRLNEQKAPITTLDILEKDGSIALTTLKKRLITNLESVAWDKESKIKYFIQEYLMWLYIKEYKGKIPPLQKFLDDIKEISDNTKTPDDLNQLRYLELFTALALRVGDHDFIAETLTSQLSNQNPDLPIDSRGANKTERKIMVLLLKEIAYELLMQKDYKRILGKFTPLPTDAPHIQKHKKMCQVYIKTLISEIVDGIKITSQLQLRKDDIEKFLSTVTALDKKVFQKMIPGDSEGIDMNNIANLVTVFLWNPIQDIENLGKKS
ncbi:MAG: hypothetical protein K2X98_03435 [Alphaproteobacteria bacterium]|nr:hypothetical protein [Alphaproteobacteria bacterium]